MKKLIVIFVFFSFSLFAQKEVKQLTNFDFDVSSPAFVNYSEFGGGINYLFFETHNGDSSNIAYLEYSHTDDSFDNLFYITRDGYINKNPQAFFNPDGNIVVVWETNRNGNFDIAYRKKTLGGDWEPMQIITNTPEDEENVKLANNVINSVIFKRGENVIIKNILDTSLQEDTVFTDGNGVTYSQADAGCSLVTAIKDSAGTESLIYKIKENNEWSAEKKIDVEGIPSNPNIQLPEIITYNVTNANKTSIYSLELFSHNIEPEVNFSDSVYSMFNIRSLFLLIVTKKDWVNSYPYVFEKKNQDSVFVVASTDYDKDTTVAVNITSPEYDNGIVDVVNAYYVIYSAWTDSVNGHKNLFGVKQLVNIGGVEDETTEVSGFKLYQNYPNPFGKGESGASATVIKYFIPELKAGAGLSRKAELTVYDLLGRKVATLVNKVQTAGEHSVTFDSGNLPSGVYLYRLSVGKYSITRKMILMK